jgi:2-polyprenyl-3-methyl-5-hydroxy-6-metoxy-1,4-benzoquinol methylase
MSDAPEIDKAAAQVAWALIRLPAGPFTREELRAAYAQRPMEEPADWTAVIGEYVARGFLRRDGDRYTLTDAGAAHTEQVRGENFGEDLVAIDESDAYHSLCERVYGRDLGQCSMTTMEQLDALLAVLALQPGNRVLDVGCGVGRIAEYIADVTGAHVTGLDFAGPALRRARERTAGKADRLTYVQGSLNRLGALADRFDAVIAVDTLYFAEDLEATLRAMQELASPGHLGLMWSQEVRDCEDLDGLRPERTQLGRALAAAGLPFATIDYTEAEKRQWRRKMEVLDQLKPMFAAEGITRQYEGLVRETQHVLQAVEGHRVSRFLYHVRC